MSSVPGAPCRLAQHAGQLEQAAVGRRRRRGRWATSGRSCRPAARRRPRPRRPWPARRSRRGATRRPSGRPAGRKPHRAQQARARRSLPGASLPAAARGLLVGHGDADLRARPPRASRRRWRWVESTRRSARGATETSRRLRTARSARRPRTASAYRGRPTVSAPGRHRLRPLELEGPVEGAGARSTSASAMMQVMRISDGGDHLDVDALVGQRAEHARRVARARSGCRPRRSRPWRRASSVVSSRAPISRTTGSRIRCARARSTRGIVNDRSVVPAWPTFWTIMSTLMPASASGAKRRGRCPAGPARRPR